MSARSLRAACLIAVLASTDAAATLVVQRPVTELVASADLIVVASVSSRKSGATGSVITLAVQRSLKGVAATSAVTATLPGAEVHDLGGDSHGLWFLSTTAVPGDVVVLAPTNGDLLRDAFIALPRHCAPPVAGEAASPLDKVADELRAALRCNAPVAEIAPAVGAASILVIMSTEPDSDRPLTAASGGVVHALAKELDAAVVGRIEAEIQGGRAEQLPIELLIGLYNVADPAVWRGVARIVAAAERPTASRESRWWTLYRGGAMALRNIHTEETLPALARLLDSSDVDIRQTAIHGFGNHANGVASSRTGGGPSGTSPYASSQTRRNLPATDIFRADPERYVGFWKRWYTCLPCRLDLGAPTIALRHTVACSATTCTTVVRADVSDPDGDNVRVSWEGCEASSVDDLECAVVASPPGVVRVQARARDSYGIASAAALEVKIPPARD